jgi:hypothetical protein
MKALVAPSATLKQNATHAEEISPAKSIAVKYFLSSSAAAVAETGKTNSVFSRFSFFLAVECYIHFFLVTYPLDIIKTRLQIQGELLKQEPVHVAQSNRIPHGMFGIAVNIGIFVLFLDFENIKALISI